MAVVPRIHTTGTPCWDLFPREIVHLTAITLSDVVDKEGFFLGITSRTSLALSLRGTLPFGFSRKRNCTVVFYENLAIVLCEQH